MMRLPVVEMSDGREDIWNYVKVIYSESSPRVILPGVTGIFRILQKGITTEICKSNVHRKPQFST